MRRYVGSSAAGESPERRAEAERVLHAAVDALLDVARRTPGFDVTVRAGPPGGPAVRLHYTDIGLVADRLGVRGRSRTREPVAPGLDEAEVASELASLLWSGEAGR